MKNARIICNGDPDDFTIYDADTGKPINIPIAEVRWTISAQEHAKLQLIGYGYAATVDGEATIVAVPPWRTDYSFEILDKILVCLRHRADVHAATVSADPRYIKLHENGATYDVADIEAWMPLPPRYVKEG